MRISSIPNDNSEFAAELFSALGHPLRLALVRTLMHRPMCGARLAVALDAPQSTISRNLAILWRAGIVRREQRGAFVRYRCSESVGGVSLQPLYELVAALVPDTYDEEAVNAELARRGITTPAPTEF